jgi:hypothetical protein
VEWFKPIRRRGPRTLYRIAYAAAVGFFVWTAAQYYIPGKGFTCLIFFGGASNVRRIRELQSLDYYVDKDSNGYDGQYYAQLAVKPLLMSRDVAAAMDNLPYRARRILFSWTAYLLGLGQPAWVLQAYALQNIIAWLLLAWLLLRWFPPTGPGNLVRWAGVMFAWGLTMSVREALMDGPSLLLIAWGVALFERGRRWSSTCVLGVAGLGRETNLLAVLALAPGRDWSGREVLRAAGRGLVAVMPLALWVACIWYVCDQPSNAGVGNFGRPFAAYFGKWFAAVRDYRVNGWDSSAKWTLIMLTSLTVQMLVILLRPQWTHPWWRVGAPFAVLLILLGPAVWDGFPGAAARVVVPMTLAFNVLVPRGLRWWPILILGNLSALSAVDQLRPPGIESYRLEGPVNVWRAPAQETIAVDFGEAWYQPEKSHFEYWRWSRGPAAMRIRNPQSFPVEVNLRFSLRALDERTVRVVEGATVRWAGRVDRNGTAVNIPHVRLLPGDNRWQFETDKPSIVPEGDILRPVAFNLRNFVIEAVPPLAAPSPPAGPARPGG